MQTRTLCTMPTRSDFRIERTLLVSATSHGDHKRNQAVGLTLACRSRRDPWKEEVSTSLAPPLPYDSSTTKDAHCSQHVRNSNCSKCQRPIHNCGQARPPLAMQIPCQTSCRQAQNGQTHGLRLGQLFAGASKGLRYWTEMCGALSRGVSCMSYVQRQMTV